MPAPNGYLSGGKIDTGWWLEQVTQGQEFRKKCAHEDRWDVWRSYYRGKWAPNTLPSNLFFKMLRTVVPRIYFRNPSISISAGKPGFESIAFAKVLEGVDNKLLRRMGMKKEIKKIVQNAFQWGTGFGKLGYGAEFTPTPDSAAGNVSAPLQSGKYLVEYNSDIRENMPWFKSCHPGTIIVPKGTTDLASTRWIAHWIRRPADDVRNDARLKNNKDLAESKEFAGGHPHGKVNKRFTEPVGMVDLIEIRDKKTGKVMVISPYRRGNTVMFEDEDDLQVDGGLPFYDLVFNPDDEYIWGTPDSLIMEPQQLELNEVRTQFMKHRRMSLVKVFVQVGGMDEEEAAKIVDEHVTPIIWTKANPDAILKSLQTAQIPPDLIPAAEMCIRDVRENIGFGRNEFGEYNPTSADVTAAEVHAVSSASAIRVDERRDMVADMLVSSVSDMHHIIFNRWTGENVVDIIGPDGALVWVSFKGTMLKGGAYEVSIDPDSALPETKDLREQKALRVFELLNGDPLTDQVKLRKNLLRSLQGVQYEDMLVQDQGMMPGMNPEMPMPIEQFAQSLSPAGRAAMALQPQGG